MSRGVQAGAATPVVVVDPTTREIMAGGALPVVNVGGSVTDSNLQLNTLQIGTGDTYLFNYQSEGDLYSEDGKFYMGAGGVFVAEQYGNALNVRGSAPVSTKVYLINATYTAATQTITKAGETFVSDGVVVGDFVSIVSSTPSYPGLVAEIESLTETTLVISMAAVGAVAIPDLTAVNFGTFSPPIALFLDNGDMHFNVGNATEAHFHIHNIYGINDRTIFVKDVAGVNGHTMMDIEVDAGAYSGVSALIIDFDASGFDDVADVGTILDVAIDNTGAGAGDIHVLDVAIADTGNASLEIEALATHQGVDVIAQYIGTAAAVASGWSNDSGVFTDRTAAFNNAGTDVELFPADNDYILIASATKFDEINVALNTRANKNINADFEYSVADGSWVEFTPADDTEGFQIPATIRFSSDALTTWGQRTVNEVTGEPGAIDYYWIRITRKRNNLATPPVEDTIQVTAITGKYGWDKNALLSIMRYTQADEPTTGQLGAAKMCWWIDSDDSSLRLCYNQAGTVKTALFT
ncbi:MAG: hypothetical protein GY743_23645 [Planctomycetaceae bacterium]|nr:hypothetical protein [Planctomycetaceae bacterium]